jgi:hypothetical protein
MKLSHAEKLPARGDSDRDRFAARVLDAIRRAGDTSSIEYDRQNFQFVKVDSEDPEFKLGTFFSQYRDIPEQYHDAFINRVLLFWCGIYWPVPKHFKDAAPYVRLWIGPRRMAESLRLIAWLDWGDLTPAHEVVGEHLATGLIYVTSHIRKFVTPAMLNQWNVDYVEATAVALEHRHKDSPDRWYRPMDGVYVGAWPDGGHAVRLVMPEFFRNLSLRGSAVAAVPNQGTLIVTGDNDDKGLDWLAARCDREFEPASEQSITGIVFRLTDGKWTPWLPRPDHATFARFRSLYIKSQRHEYKAQADIMLRSASNLGYSYISPYTVRRDPHGQFLLSICGWTDGIVSLLPRTDYIGFVMLKGAREYGVIAARWEQVSETLGHLMEPMDMYPERYRVRRFPTREEFAAVDNTGVTAELGAGQWTESLGISGKVAIVQKSLRTKNSRSRPHGQPDAKAETPDLLRLTDDDGGEWLTDF